MKYQISLLQKALYSMMMLAIFLAAFGTWNFRSVHAAGTHQITYFRDNKAGAVSFTFDDGYTSQAATVVNELNIRGLKGTFFVITGSDWINSHVPWSSWQGLVAQGHEVAAHTVTHTDLTTISEGEMRWEMTESQAAIMQNVPGQACASLSYPTTASNATVQAAASDYFVAARGGFLGDGYLNYYQSGSDQSGSWTAMNFYNVGSRSSDGLIPASDQYFNSLLNTAAARHAWFSLHFHTINASAFGSILDYIQGKPEYWIDTFCNISRYMKERLNSTVQVLTDTSSEIKLSIVMDASLPTDIYNFPLTLRSTVPASWTQVIVQQGIDIQTLTPVLEGSENVIYYNAVPNGGDVSLVVSTPTATNTLVSTPTGTSTIISTHTPTFTPSPIFTLTSSRTPTVTATTVALPWYAPTGSTLVTAVTNPNNAFTSNNAYATFNANGNTVNYTTFGNPDIPAGATINGIEVSVEGYNGQAAGRNLQIQLSWNGGANFTAVTAGRTTNLPITDGIVILGGAADTWGRAWSTTEFTNVNFTIKATSTGGAVPPVYLDQLQVRIYYTIAGNTPVPTYTSTSLPTFTATNAPTVTLTNTLTSTPISTATSTFTFTPTNTSTSIPTFTATNVPTSISTDTLTYTPTPTYTTTDTATTIPSSTPTFTATDAPTITLTHTPTVTNTSTNTPVSPSNTPTLTRTNTPTNFPTNTATPTNTLPPPTTTTTSLPAPANTGFLNPGASTAQTGGDGNGYGTNPSSAYTNNGIFAVDSNSGTNSDSSCTSSGKDKHQFYNYGFSIPSTTVLGIEVRLDAKADSTSGAPKLCIQLSWNAGTSWTTAKQTGTLTTTEQTYTLGSPSDNWGHTWTLSQLSNANFRVRIIDVATNTSRDFSLDWITVRVTYQ